MLKAKKGHVSVSVGENVKQQANIQASCLTYHPALGGAEARSSQIQGQHGLLSIRPFL